MRRWALPSLEVMVWGLAVAFAGGTRQAIEARKAAVQRTYWSSRMVDNRRFGT